MTHNAIARPDTPHAHDSSCWWNPQHATWQCAGHLVDIRDMLVVHTALLREFRLAPLAVGRVAVGDRPQLDVLERHLELICGMLHHHHSGEDELLWPVLEPRLSTTSRELLVLAESQHGAIDAALQRVNEARRAFAEHIDEPTRTALATELSTLYPLLAEHLETEERELLPLAAAFLLDDEWHAIGAAGAASTPKSQMPLVFGMFGYEGDPVVLKQMLSGAPLLPRKILPLIAGRAYAKHAARLYGTRRP